MTTNLTEAWLINNSRPYGKNEIIGGILTGNYNATDNGDLIVENITMNDNRNGTEYICVIYDTINNMIINQSHRTCLYVAGE